MKKKSTYNMVVSILSGVASIVFLTLGVIFKAINKNPLGIIFTSITFSFMSANYIFKSLFYAKDISKSKTVFYRLSKTFTDVFTTLISIYFVLRLDTYIKWLLFGLIIIIMIIEVLLDSFDKLTEIRYLLYALNYFILIFTLLNIYNFNVLFSICLLSLLIDYTSNFLGRILDNKLILSFEIIFVILFGIFYILT